jgi:hypothetical protein
MSSPTKTLSLPNSNAAVTKPKRFRYQPKTLSLPNSIAVVTKFKHTMSRSGNERHQEHHAGQKFGRHPICQIRRIMALRYIIYVKICIFQLFFQKKLPATFSFLICRPG